MKPLLLTLFVIHAIIALNLAGNICNGKGSPTTNLMSLLFELTLCIWIAMVLW